MKTNAICGSSAGSFAQSRSQRVLRSCPALETSCLIGQTLADEALDRKISARLIVDPQLLTVGVAEIKLGKVAMQMRFADMEVAADDPALQDRKEALNRIGMEWAAHVLVAAVIYGFVPEGAPHSVIVARLIGAKQRRIVNLGNQNGAEVIGVDAANVHGTDAAIPFDERKDGFLASNAAASFAKAPVLVLLLAADESLIDLDGCTFAAERPDHAVLHRFTNAMRQEPRGFHAALKHPLDLAGRNAFLAGAHQVDHLKPQVKRKVAILEDGSHADGEGATASVALAKAGAAALALQPANAIRVAIPAMRANRALRPKQRFDIRERGFLIVEVGSAQNRLSHGYSPVCGRTLRLAVGVVKCNTPAKVNAGNDANLIGFGREVPPF